MITEKLRKAIANRAATDDEWDYGVQQSWKEVSYLILYIKILGITRFRVEI